MKLGQFEGKRVTGADVENIQSTDYAWEVGMIFKQIHFHLDVCHYLRFADTAHMVETVLP